jgi:tetratricopeptide (TPR) repeat protein
MPNNTSILNNLAYMLAKNNERLAEALKYAERANEIRPNSPALLDTYAYVLYKNDKVSEAVEFFQAALQQYEVNKIPVPAEVYENLGVTKEKLGARSEAIAAYERALQAGAETLSEPARQRITEAIERLSRQGGDESP